MAVREIMTRLAIDGEQEYNRSIKDASRNIAVMGSEMRASSAEFAANDKGMESLTAKSKGLSQQIKQQEQIVESLTAAVKESAEKYGEADKRTDDYRIKLNNARSSLVNMENQLETTEKQMSGYSKVTLKAAMDSEEFKASQEKVTSSLKAVGAGIGIVAGAAVGLGAAFAKAGLAADDLNTLAKTTGLTTAELQKFKYAEELIDVSLETMTGSMTKLIKSMSAAKIGTKQTVDAFEQLGITFRNDVTGELRSGQDVFDEIIEALGKVENETERDAIAMQLLGKSARDLNPLIAGGAADLRKLGKEAETLGLILSQDALDGLNEINDVVDTFNSRLRAAGMTVLAEFADPVNDALASIDFDKITRGVIDFVSFIKQNEHVVIAAITGIGVGFVAWNITSMVLGVVGAIQTLKTAIDTATVAQTIFNAAQASNPVGLVVTAVAAATAAIIAFSIVLNDTTTEAEETAKGVMAMHEEFEALTKTMDENRAAYQKMRTEIGGNATAARKLVKEIDALAAKENKSAKEKTELANKTKVLNELVEGLNLSYNEQTGVLSQSTAEMENHIRAQEALLQFRAAEENTLQIARDKIAAEQELNIALEKQYQIKADLAMLRVDPYADQEAMYQLSAALNDSVALTDLQKTKIEELAVEYHVASEVLTEYGENLIGTNADVIASNDEVSESVREMTDEEKKALDELQKKREETLQKYASDTQNAFGKINQSTKLSLKEMTDNLQSNQNTVRQWTIDLGTLAHRGFDEGFLAELEKLGPESAKTVAGMTKATQPEIDAFNATYRAGGEQARLLMTEEMTMLAAANPAGAALTGMAMSVEESTELEDAFVKSVNEAKTGMSIEINRLNFPRLGLDITDGVAQGVRDGTASVVDAMRSMARQAIAAAKAELDINSPSRVARKILGLSLPEGTALGIEDGIHLVERAMRKLSDAAKDNMQPAGGGVTVKLQGQQEGTREAGQETGRGTINQVVNVYSPEPLSPSQVAREAKLALWGL